MTIQPDVKRIARKFGIDPELVQAVVQAEGNIVKAVECSIPHLAHLAADRGITAREYALEVVCRSAAHAMSDWIKLNAAPDFVAFWGARWAPEGAQNDPTSLNKNWPVNVTRLWLDLT